MTQAKILGPIGVKAFEGRGINPETATRFGTYTVKPGAGAEVVADPKGNVIAFPYFEHGRVVAEKYRGPNKKFWQRPGGRRTFYNSDILDDPALERGDAALIITEGEIDALTAIDNGFPFSVSVPDGAPAVPEGEEPDKLAPLDRDAEAKGKFEFVWNNRDRLKRVRRFIIAVDSDAPGQRLAAELVRRLSAARCMFVTYPDDVVVPTEDGGMRPCKDLNEVQMYVGPGAVAEVLNGARSYPVHGLYQLADYPDLPALETVSTGWVTLDEHYKPFLGGLTILIGIPGHGKSALVENMVVNLAMQHSWRAALFSPEQPTVPHMRDRLRPIVMDKAVEHASASELSNADDWINEKIVFIAGDPSGENDDEAYMEWVLDRAADAVMRHGIKVLVIDPWNEIEQLRRRGEMQTEYIGRALRMVNQFRRRYNVLVFLLVHPTKEVGKEGKARPPTPYDTDGSAHFFNKADHFIVVHRQAKETREVAVRVAKVKFKGTGVEGSVRLLFNEATNRFGYLDGGAP